MIEIKQSEGNFWSLAAEALPRNARTDEILAARAEAELHLKERQQAVSTHSTSRKATSISNDYTLAQQRLL